MYTLNCVSILTVLVRNLNILWLFYAKIVLLFNAILYYKYFAQIYDKSSIIIECELIAYVLDNIVYATLHEK